MRLAAEIVSGFGSVFGSFGARTAASAPTLPLPLRSRKRAKERAPASVRISERLLMSSRLRAAFGQRGPRGVHDYRKEIVVADDAQQIDHALLAEFCHGAPIGGVADA